MDTPEILEGWVAEDGQPTPVMDPCFIEPAALELRPWHPGFDADEAHSFMHLPDRDDCGYYTHTEVGSFSGNWNDDMKAVMLALKLRPFPTGSGTASMLMDDDIGQIDTPLMLGWKVIRWMAVKNLDDKGTELHQDLITWRHTSGMVARSMFTWRPYRSEELQKQPFKGMTSNAGSGVGVAPAL
jgi:hypothetical protein